MSETIYSNTKYFVRTKNVPNYDQQQALKANDVWDVEAGATFERDTPELYAWYEVVNAETGVVEKATPVLPTALSHADYFEDQLLRTPWKKEIEFVRTMSEAQASDNPVVGEQNGQPSSPTPLN